jgi:hypothetical protein
LSEPERRVFRCLGVFVGRVSLDAIDAVVRMVEPVGSAASGAEAREVTEDGRTLPRLLSLAENSLLLPPPAELAGGTTDVTGLEEDNEDPEPVFTLLETVREYA